MFAALLAVCLSASNDVGKRDISRAVRKELGRMYLMQTFLGPYAPYFMMFGDRMPFFFNGMNLPFNKMPGFANAVNEDYDYDENADEENIDRRDVQSAVRRELQRMYMMQFMFQNLPKGDRPNQFPFAFPQDGQFNPMLLPFLYGMNGKNQEKMSVNEDYYDDDYANDYDYDDDYDYNEDDYYYE